MKAWARSTSTVQVHKKIQCPQSNSKVFCFYAHNKCICRKHLDILRMTHMCGMLFGTLSLLVFPGETVQVSLTDLERVCIYWSVITRIFSLDDETIRLHPEASIADQTRSTRIGKNSCDAKTMPTPRATNFVSISVLVFFNCLAPFFFEGGAPHAMRKCLWCTKRNEHPATCLHVVYCVTLTHAHTHTTVNVERAATQIKIIQSTIEPINNSSGNTPVGNNHCLSWVHAWS